MEARITSWILCLILIPFSKAIELTFELPDSEKECFFEAIESGTPSTLEFQVITGGHYDVDLEITAPNGQILYKDVKKQYDSFAWTADQSGVYSFCFSNEFSTFSHKIVYFDLESGLEKPLMKGMETQAKAMTLMESSAQNTHGDLSQIMSYQTRFRLRESQGRAFGENLNYRVMMWSIGQSIVMIFISIGQVVVLRSFFADKPKSTKPVLS